MSEVLLANGRAIEKIWELQQAQKLHTDWLDDYDNRERTGVDLRVQADVVAKQYILAHHKMKRQVTASLSSYDLHAMTVGIILIFESLVGVLYGLIQQSKKKNHGNEKISILPLGLVTPTSSIVFFSGLVLALTAVHIGICSSVKIGK